MQNYQTRLNNHSANAIREIAAQEKAKEQKAYWARIEANLLKRRSA